MTADSGSLLQVADLEVVFTTRQGVTHAVNGVTFKIEPGEIAALVGESGSGKTVTALALMRLLPRRIATVTAGAVVLEGTDLLRLPESQMRRFRGRQISMVFQEPMTSLNPVLTIGKQLTETLQAHFGLRGRAANARAVELLEMVGVPDAERRVQDYPHRLSGGMRQRVMIAMALSCQPKLLVADEPTTALDVTIQAQVLELMTSLARELGTAVLIITHNLGVVARYADRVHVMYAGRLVESGPSRSIYYQSRHPYTLGLLRSVPRLDQDRRDGLVGIEGSPPDMTTLQLGCAFAPRCQFATEHCACEVPPHFSVGSEHESACWEWAQLASAVRLAGQSNPDPSQSRRAP
jgi:oligopeptide/dipeptide ABC transporter ATP-binding protein